MADFQTVAKVGDIPAGEGRTYPVNGRMVAVFFIDGEYKAINDSCPHMGASLAGGWVEEGAVSCPWHAWRFCLDDGRWLDAPKANVKVDCYEVRIQNEEIQVKVEPPPGPQTPTETEQEE